MDLESLALEAKEKHSKNLMNSRQKIVIAKLKYLLGRAFEQVENIEMELNKQLMSINVDGFVFLYDFEVEQLFYVSGEALFPVNELHELGEALEDTAYIDARWLMIDDEPAKDPLAILAEALKPYL